MLYLSVLIARKRLEFLEEREILVLSVLSVGLNLLRRLDFWL